MVCLSFILLETYPLTKKEKVCLNLTLIILFENIFVHIFQNICNFSSRNLWNVNHQDLARKGIKAQETFPQVNYNKHKSKYSFFLIFGIRCTFWFNARSRIIENNLRGWFFLFLAPVVGCNPAGHYPNPFPNPAGQS